MKRKEISEIHGKKVAELAQEIELLQKDIAKLQIEVKANPAKNTNAVSKNKYRLAVLKTVLNENKRTQ